MQLKYFQYCRIYQNQGFCMMGWLILGKIFLVLQDSPKLGLLKPTKCRSNCANLLYCNNISRPAQPAENEQKDVKLQLGQICNVLSTPLFQSTISLPLLGKKRCMLPFLLIFSLLKEKVTPISLFLIKKRVALLFHSHFWEWSLGAVLNRVHTALQHIANLAVGHQNRVLWILMMGLADL